jgi:hypothetical protein
MADNMRITSKRCGRRKYHIIFLEEMNTRLENGISKNMRYDC